MADFRQPPSPTSGPPSGAEARNPDLSGLRGRWQRHGDWPDLLEALRVDETRVRLELSLAADTPWVEGHFPGQPVLPGVVQLRWAIGAAALLWPALESVTAVTQLKFQNPILPPADLSLELSLKSGDSRLQFLYRQGDTPCSRGQVRFA